MAQSILDSVFSGESGLAKTLINLLGGDANIYLPESGTYDPLTGDRTGGGLGSAIAVDASPLEDIVEKNIPNSNVIVGDFKSLIPKSDVTIEREHLQKAQLEYNGVRYTLVWYEVTYSGQEIAMYEVYLRNL